MHPFLHLLLIVALIAGSFPIAQPARTTSQPAQISLANLGSQLLAALQQVVTDWFQDPTDEPTTTEDENDPGTYPADAVLVAGDGSESLSAKPSPYRLSLRAALVEEADSSQATLDWEVNQWTASADLELVLTLPAGLTPRLETPLNATLEAHTWRMKLDRAAGSLLFDLAEAAALPVEIRGEIWHKGQVQDEYSSILEGLRAQDSEKLTPLSIDGGSIVGLEGKVRVDFPQDALSEAAEVQIQPIAPQVGARFLGSGQAFSILAKGTTSQEAIHQFEKSIIIQIAYDPEQYAGNEQSLVLTYFDEPAQEWLPLPSWVDSEAHVLYARSSHLSLFNPDIHSMDLARLPSLKNYSTSLFTGAGSYTYPLALPPGPGGLQPELALSYNSQVVDSAGDVTQASWVGMGWALETGKIERNMNGTSDYLGDDTYTLSIGSFSSQLVPGADGYYHTGEENFWKIQKNANDTWTVWDKSGNVYEFGIDYPSGTFASGSGLSNDLYVLYPTATPSRLTYETYDWEACDNSGQQTWQWPLVRQKNKYQGDANNSLLYVYHYDRKMTQPDADCDDQQRKFIHAAYPQAIIYPNRRYRVHFLLENRYDYKESWTTLGSRTTFMKRKLDKIQVEHDADGNGTYEQILRAYDLTYAEPGSAEQIFPGIVWSAGGVTPTLTQISETGVSGATGLPATTFRYSTDKMHLNQVENGYGGSASLSYSAWSTVPATPSAATRDDFYLDESGLWKGNIFITEGLNQYYTRVCQGYIDEQTGDPVCTGPGEAYRYFDTPSKNLYPGQVYKIYGSFSGTGMQVGLRALNAAGSEIWRELKPATPTNDLSGNYYFVLPTNAAQVEAIVKCTSCSMTTFSIDRILTRYRVAQQTLTPGNGGAAGTTTYAYSGSNVNQQGSFDGACPNSNHTTHKECMNYPFSQFLGHHQVSETSPGGRKTVTQFYQDDNGNTDPPSPTNQKYQLLGKVRQVDVYDASDPDPAETTIISRKLYTYAITDNSPAKSTDPNISPHQQGSSLLYTEIRITWPRLILAEERVFEPGHLHNDPNVWPNIPFAGTRTEYHYETGLQNITGYNKQYGNLTHQVTSHWNGAQWVDERLSIRAFRPNPTLTGVYLPGLLAWTNEYGCPGTTGGNCFDPGDPMYPASTTDLASSTTYQYDGSTNYLTSPTTGILTGQRAFIEFVSGQARYRNTTYTYRCNGKSIGEKEKVVGVV